MWEIKAACCHWWLKDGESYGNGPVHKRAGVIHISMNIKTLIVLGKMKILHDWDLSNKIYNDNWNIGLSDKW